MRNIWEKYVTTDTESAPTIEIEKADNRKKSHGMTLGSMCHYISFEEKLRMIHDKPPTLDQITLAIGLGISQEIIDRSNCAQMKCLLDRTIQESFRTMLAQREIFVNTIVIDENGQQGKVASINYFSRIIIIQYLIDGKIKSRRIKLHDFENIKVVGKRKTRS